MQKEKQLPEQLLKIEQLFKVGNTALDIPAGTLTTFLAKHTDQITPTELNNLFY